MFFRDLKPKTGVTLNVILADVHLPVKIGHRSAVQLFADPLKDQLAVTGRGSVLDCKLRKRQAGDVAGVDLFLGLTDASLPGLKVVTAMLEAMAAPCGSSIRLSEGTGHPIVFGRTEGLELSIHSDATPDADTRRELAMTCRDAMENYGVSRGWDERRDQTLFYFYGESFEAMKTKITRILDGHPQFSSATLRRMA